MQNIRLQGRINLVLDVDLFNVFNNQTGYSIQPGFSSANFGLSFAPRMHTDLHESRIFHFHPCASGTSGLPTA